jgi:hypothetical protein
VIASASGAQRDLSVADKDWRKELAKVDKQIASLSDDQLGARPAPGTASQRAPAGKGAAPEPVKRTSTIGVYARLTLAVALGVGMVLWPYEARCGLGLAAYLAAVAVVITSGVWSAVWSWRHRAGPAHVLSLLLILWGLVLGSIAVLPRVGYAKPDAAHPATWGC